MIDHNITSWLDISPRIRLARLKFELTNQESAGGKNFTVVDVNVS